MLDVRNLRKVYEGSGRRIEAVRDLTFTVEAGELVCLVGPSGCGKTTLLKCVGGLLTPSGGEVSLAGARCTGRRPEWRSSSRSTGAASSRGCASAPTSNCR